jgi:predicted DCC family thiol-disulfide oxidoreductase YuxK
MFFDADCAFCSRSVRWIARLDGAGRIRFAPLRGKLGREKGLESWADAQNGTVVLLRESDGKFFYSSDAVVEIGMALGGVWGILTLARWIPKAWRDALYRLVARNRYRLVRKSSTCELAGSKLRSRLLE